MVVKEGPGRDGWDNVLADMHVHELRTNAELEVHQG